MLYPSQRHLGATDGLVLAPMGLKGWTPTKYQRQTEG